MTRRHAFSRAAALALVTALFVTGCSATPPEAITPTGEASTPLDRTWSLPDKDDAIHAMLPQEIRDRGTLVAATDPLTPPYEFVADDNTTIIGMDPDLAAALGAVLGVEIRFETVAFSGIIPAIASERYDLSLLSMFDTRERQEQLDFVDYLIEGTRLVVRAGNPDNLQSLEDLCGRTVSVLQGSVMLSLLEERQSACAEPMTIAVAQSTADQLLQLQTKRADATLANGSVTQYVIDHEGGGDLEVLLNELYTPGYMGFGFAKGNSEVRDAVRAALQSIIEDGTYAEILEFWGATTANAVAEAGLNQGGTL